MLQHSSSLCNGCWNHSTDQKQAWHSRLNVKNTLTAFFDCQGGAHYVFVPRDQTVNKEFCLIILQCVWGLAQKKQAWANMACFFTVTRHFLPKKVYHKKQNSPGATATPYRALISLQAFSCSQNWHSAQNDIDLNQRRKYKKKHYSSQPTAHKNYIRNAGKSLII
jgi:hypothetical protein